MLSAVERLELARSGWDKDLIALAQVAGYHKVIGGKVVNVGAYATSKVVHGFRLENHSGGSNKFYESSVFAHPNGTATHVIRFGSTLAGHKAQVLVGHHDTMHAALTAHHEKLAQKTAGGYHVASTVEADNISHLHVANPQTQIELKARSAMEAAPLHQGSHAADDTSHKAAADQAKHLEDAKSKVMDAASQLHHDVFQIGSQLPDSYSPEHEALSNAARNLSDHIDMHDPSADDVSERAQDVVHLSKFVPRQHLPRDAMAQLHAAAGSPNADLSGYEHNMPELHDLHALAYKHNMNEDAGGEGFVTVHHGDHTHEFGGSIQGEKYGKSSDVSNFARAAAAHMKGRASHEIDDHGSWEVKPK